jgi:hypothetical protein
VCEYKALKDGKEIVQLRCCYGITSFQFLNSGSAIEMRLLGSVGDVGLWVDRLTMGRTGKEQELETPLQTVFSFLQSLVLPAKIKLCRIVRAWTVTR